MNPGENIIKMQEILISKEKDEEEVDKQLKEGIAKKEKALNFGNITMELQKELEEAKKEGAAGAKYNLKNVIFQKDEFQMKLKQANEEIGRLKQQLENFREINVQMQTFEDEDVNEKLDYYTANITKDLPDDQ